MFELEVVNAAEHLFQKKNTNEVAVLLRALPAPASASRTCMQTHAHTSLASGLKRPEVPGERAPLVPAVRNIESGSSPRF